MPKKGQQGPCSVLGCGKPIKVKNWCFNHYRHQLIYGRPDRINTGTKRSHLLYSIWFERRARGSLCAAWAADFWAFVAAVGERPSPTHLLRRIDPSRPYEAGNWEWLAALKREAGETRQAFNARKWQARRLRDPHYERGRSLKRKYGINQGEYDAKLAEQGGACAICREPESAVDSRTGAPKALAVDHCHTTKRVRALLCWRCNTMIGKVEERPDLLHAMVAYLAAWA